MSARRSVTIVSPHFDDVPLSLGQSLRDGALSRCDVRVRIVFGRSNWTTRFHPTPSRATPVSWWRRAEETVAARAFGYRFSVADWQEALLRWGTPGGDRLLDADADLSDEPLVAEVADWLRRLAIPRGEPVPDLLLVPAGLGGHVDHRIVALAAASLADWSGTDGSDAGGSGDGGGEGAPLGFYEDRPYVAHLDQEAVAAQLAALGTDLEARAVSGPVSAATQRRVRRCYPSQIDEYFIEAMERDLAAGAVERVWFPAGAVPPWLV